MFVRPVPPFDADPPFLGEFDFGLDVGGGGGALAAVGNAGEAQQGGTASGAVLPKAEADSCGLRNPWLAE